MRKIVDHFINTGTRLEAFRRPKKKTLEENNLAETSVTNAVPQSNSSTSTSTSLSASAPASASTSSSASASVSVSVSTSARLPSAKPVIVHPKVPKGSKLPIKIIPTHTKIGSNSQVRISTITPKIKSKRDTMEKDPVEPIELRRSNVEKSAGELKIQPAKSVTVHSKVQNDSKLPIPRHTKIGSNSEVKISTITPIIKSKRDTNRFDNGNSETVAVELLPLQSNAEKSAGELKNLPVELPLSELPNVLISKDQGKSYVSNCREYSDHKGDGQTIQKRNKIILKIDLIPKRITW